MAEDAAKFCLAIRHFEISSLQSSNWCAHAHESDLYPTGRLFWTGDRGTSCLATIILSLRDEIHSAPRREDAKNWSGPIGHTA